MRIEQATETATESARPGRGLERLRIPAEQKASSGGGMRWFALLLATTAASVGGWSYYNNKGFSDLSIPLRWPTRAPETTPETTVVLLRDMQTRDIVTAGGYAVTQTKVHLGSELAGKIKKIAIDKGDRVKKGDLIAELENESYRIEITRAKADAGLAKANADRYRKSFDRLQELYRVHSISKDEFDEARRLAETSGLGVEVAEARHASAVCEYNKTFIRSPLSGVVVKKFLNVGDAVSPMTPFTENMDTLCTGTPIVSLVDPSDVKIEVDVSEESIAKVKLGQVAEVTPMVHPEPRLKAEVFRIAVEANRKKHAIQVELRLKDAVPVYLKPEVEVKASITCDDQEPAPPVLLVDRRAVLQRGESSFVYIVDLGRATLRLVEIARGDETHSKVLKGVKKGDKLVLNPDKNWPDEVTLTP
jgi:RND family efflux transporter MFP subunit